MEQSRKQELADKAKEFSNTRVGNTLSKPHEFREFVRTLNLQEEREYVTGVWLEHTNVFPFSFLSEDVKWSTTAEVTEHLKKNPHFIEEDRAHLVEQFMLQIEAPKYIGDFDAAVRSLSQIFETWEPSSSADNIVARLLKLTQNTTGGNPFFAAWRIADYLPVKESVVISSLSNMSERMDLSTFILIAQHKDMGRDFALFSLDNFPPMYISQMINRRPEYIEFPVFRQRLEERLHTRRFKGGAENLDMAISDIKAFFVLNSEEEDVTFWGERLLEEKNAGASAYVASTIADEKLLFLPKELLAQALSAIGSQTDRRELFERLRSIENMTFKLR